MDAEKPANTTANADQKNSEIRFARFTLIPVGWGLVGHYISSPTTCKDQSGTVDFQFATQIHDVDFQSI